MDKTSGDSLQNRRKRGHTLMKGVRALKDYDIKLELEWDSFEAPIGKNAAKLTSFIGVVARSKCDIRHTWDSIEDHVKESIWNEINDVFIIPVDKKKWILQKAAAGAKKFRTRLTKEVRDANGNVRPNPPAGCDSVTPEMWAEFCAERTSDDFMVRSDINKALAEKHQYHYRRGRMSYGGVRQEIAESDGLDNNGLIPRHKQWLNARMGKNGELPEPIKKIKEKIDAKLKEPQACIIGENDILSQVLATPEHPGRIRGLGSGVKKRDYFGPTSKSNNLTKELKELKEKYNDVNRKYDALLGVFMQLQDQGIKISLPPELTPANDDDDEEGDSSDTASFSFEL